MPRGLGLILCLSRGPGVVSQVRHTPKPRPEGNLTFYLLEVIDSGDFETQPWSSDTSLLEEESLSMSIGSMSFLLKL